jgi:hypothetical protein
MRWQASNTPVTAIKVDRTTVELFLLKGTMDEYAYWSSHHFRCNYSGPISC